MIDSYVNIIFAISAKQNKAIPNSLKEAVAKVLTLISGCHSWGMDDFVVDTFFAKNAAIS